MSKEQEATQKLNKNDGLLFVGILIFAAILWVLFSFFKKDGSQVTVSLDGKLYGTYALNENRTIEINSTQGRNVILIRDGSVSVSDADCPDQICVEHAAIHRTKETIVCLPHKLVIEVTSNAVLQDNEIDGVAE